jgi:hypothetical protein
VSKYLPDFENQFDASSNILVTHPISKNGITSFKELSQLINKEVIIDQQKIPYVDKDISTFLTKEHLISNISASTSDTNMIIVSKAVATTIMEELSKHKFNPTVVGRIGKPLTADKSSRKVIYQNFDK